MVVLGFIFLFLIIAVLIGLFFEDFGIGMFAGVIVTFFVWLFGPSGSSDTEVVPPTELTQSGTEFFPMILEFLATDIVFGIASLIIFALLVFCAETERLGTALVAFLLFLVSVEIISEDGVVLSWTAENTVMLIAGLLVYLAIGVAYTLVWEWRKFCKENRDPEALSKFLLKNDEATEADYFTDPYAFNLHPKNHYYRLTNWMILWPFALFWTLLHDPFTWLARTLYDLFGGVMLKIAVKISKAGA